jgi:PKD repeat protein
MKKLGLPAALALALISCATGYSTTIVWINTAGGNWSDTASWNPNRVPISGDDAVITNAGNYTVTLDTSATVDRLVLGGNSAMAAGPIVTDNPSHL